MEQVLVTGCAGFIGSHVAESLLKQGIDVVGIDNKNDYYAASRKEKNLQLLTQYPTFTFVYGDITDQALMNRLFQEHKFSHVAHLAARAGVRASIKSPFLYAKTNILGTMSVLEAARRHPPENIVVTSSSSVYGGANVPFKEESITSRPVSPYAATKKAAEVIAYTYHQMYDLPINIVRPFTVYGPRGRPDMAPWLFLEAALKSKPVKKFGDGTTRRDYTYITDFLKGFLAALQKPLGYEIFNLGNSQTVSLNEFISVVESVTNKKLRVIQEPFQAGDVPITFADISKAKRLLQYQPNTDIRTGMQQFFSWYSQL